MRLRSYSILLLRIHIYYGIEVYVDTPFSQMLSYKLLRISQRRTTQTMINTLYIVIAALHRHNMFWQLVNFVMYVCYCGK